MPEHNQFMVWASDSLTHAELELHVEYEQSFTSPFTRPVYDRIELTVGMHKITRVIAGNYGECLERLFATWSPRQPQRQEIDRPDYRLAPKPKELNG